MIKESEITVASPGRINLIGEHLDYNGGFVMPAAIDLKTYLSFVKNYSNTCTIHSTHTKETFTFSLEEISKSDVEWHNYILGVIHFIHQKYPNSIQGFDCKIESNLPVGSGVSSSAALECGVAKGLDSLFKIGLSEDEIITIARDAEHHYVGTKCGIMDQFVVVRGRKNSIIQLNCQDLSYHYIPFELGDYKILLLNTNVSHNLATSEYNKRRKECEEGLRIIQENYPHQKVLARVPETIIESLKSKISATVRNRILYVIQENKRTQQTVKALQEKDFQTVGQLLYQSHEGLQHKYQVSCPELDFLVDASKEVNILGARMMGGGFGGCTLNLVHKSQVKSASESLKSSYKAKFGRDLSAFVVSTGDGVKVIA